MRKKVESQIKPGSRVRDNIMHRNGTVVADPAATNFRYDHLPNSIPVIFDALYEQPRLNGDLDSGLRYIPEEYLEQIGEPA